MIPVINDVYSSASSSLEALQVLASWISRNGTLQFTSITCTASSVNALSFYFTMIDTYGTIIAETSTLSGEKLHECSLP